jgi:hypothetical protein
LPHSASSFVSSLLIRQLEAGRFLPRRKRKKFRVGAPPRVGEETSKHRAEKREEAKRKERKRKIITHHDARKQHARTQSS